MAPKTATQEQERKSKVKEDKKEKGGKEEVVPSDNEGDDGSDDDCGPFIPQSHTADSSPSIELSDAGDGLWADTGGVQCRLSEERYGQTGDEWVGSLSRCSNEQTSTDACVMNSGIDELRSD
jgi:hypothetical protein